MAQVDPHAAVYTGSFDPITLGHLNVIQRCSRLVDRLIIGIGLNIEKEALFSVEERIRLVRQATSHLHNVEMRVFVTPFLFVDLVKVVTSTIIELDDLTIRYVVDLMEGRLCSFLSLMIT